jgi:hypothetical protein
MIIFYHKSIKTILSEKIPNGQIQMYQQNYNKDFIKHKYQNKKLKILFLTYTKIHTDKPTFYK